MLYEAPQLYCSGIESCAFEYWLGFDNRMDIFQDKPSYTVITECISSKKLSALEGHLSMVFFLRDDNVKKKKEKKNLQISETKEGTGNNRKK